RAVTQLTGAVALNKAPILVRNSLVNHFSQVKGDAVAPGTMSTLRGSGLASAPVAAPAAAPLPTNVNETRVLIGGVEAPLYFVSDDQVRAQIPVELTPNRQYQVLVSANGALTLPDTITLTDAQPGLQTGDTGTMAVAQHADGSPVDPSAPAARGEEISLFVVGMGLTDPPVPSGAAPADGALAKPLVQPSATIDGQPAEVVLATLMPGSVGLYQLRLRVPVEAGPGDLPVVVTQGSAQSNSGLLPVR
ncbi:MAG TPA: IPT/TIG domain-containing protein, partial [Bryobacteraceae bacterium]|nr:IPT/TIG domain-containing protein [Bryobacteraceae bacterium]